MSACYKLKLLDVIGLLPQTIYLMSTSKSCFFLKVGIGHWALITKTSRVVWKPLDCSAVEETRHDLF
ncbi:hypothetical protein [Nostoc commune]|uniref:hypothetical protein n=1 Tax=Nostoc commune TaxID=1178 RepID=UPI0018C59C8C|nr:hypothetical protein [Nostoc commune]MBG1260924.1 hypothetical protein [Nostoc commune BAE]